MPCWFYDKQELRNTPSFRDGVDPDTEARYRREGARFILDCGAKLGLRYDTYGTGAIYFHRFYMFRSFREFHRYLTACSCLFLAGKVEETPKKCKDLIKMAKTILTEQKFNKLFDDDPKEEILLVEKILLQTLKFDLMVEHPYSHLLRFGKMLKGDKAKIEKMVQMSWTFINDSLCTTLCLQWEGEVIGAALIYLATRLSKIEIHDWEGKPPGFQGKWWEHVIKEVSLDLLEDICHQVLDLYSQQMSASQKQSHQVADSPPPPPPPPPKQPTSGSAVLSSASHSSTSAGHKRSRSNTPVDVAAKKLKSQPIPTITGGSTVHANIASSGHPAAKSITPPPVHVRPNQQSDGATLPASKPTQPPIPSVGAVGVATTAIIAAPVPVETAMKDGKAYNPFVSSVSASYMSAEGGKSIQAMLAPGSHASQPAPSHISAPSGGYAGGYPTPTQPPPPGAYKHPPPGFPVTQQAGNSGNSQQYNMSQPYTAPQYGNDNMQGQNPSVPTPGTSYSGADNRAGNTVTGSGSHVGRGGSYNTAHNSRDSFQHTPHQQQYKQPPPSYSEKSSYYEKYDDERDSQYGYSQYDSGQESGGDYQRRNTGYGAPSGSGSHMGGSRDERGTGGYQQHYNPRPQSYPPGPPPPRGPYGQHPRRPRLH